jgi:hypothetical protein
MQRFLLQPATYVCGPPDANIPGLLRRLVYKRAHLPPPMVRTRNALLSTRSGPSTASDCFERLRDIGVVIGHMAVKADLTGWLPYSLAVAILVDGLEHATFCNTLHLTPNSIAVRDGLVIDSCEIDSGTNKNDEDVFRRDHWMLTEIGVVMQLAQLAIGTANVKHGDGHSSSEASIDIRCGSGSKEKAGTIEVQLYRFFPWCRRRNRFPERETEQGLQETSLKLDPSPDSLAPINVNQSLVHISSNVTHRIELVGEGQGEHLWNVDDGPWPDPDDEPDARYRIQYMSHAMLVKLGLADHDRSLLNIEQRTSRLRAVGGASSLSSKRQFNGNENDSQTGFTESATKRNKLRYELRHMHRKLLGGDQAVKQSFRRSQ